MFETVEGTYHDGKIDLKEHPAGVREARVLVTFLPEQPPRTGKMLRFGQFAGGDLTDEDFRATEWHGGDDEFNL
jgi:hypothetical protein